MRNYFNLLFFATTLFLFGISQSFGSTILQCRVKGSEETRFINQQSQLPAKPIDDFLTIEINSYEKNRQNPAEEFIELKKPIDLVIRRFPGATEQPAEFKVNYNSYVDKTNSFKYDIAYSEKFPPDGGFNTLYKNRSDVRLELDRRTGDLVFSSKKFTKELSAKNFDSITTLSIYGACDKASNRQKF